jgi:nicotinate-nucleotide adenylyltransferase
MTEKKIKKIGVFGGAFDPPHRGHVGLCRAAAREFGLDKIIVVPTGLPPHKTASSSAADRLAMTRLAFCDPLFEISEFEFGNAGKSFTYLTLEYLRRTMDGELYFIVGADSMTELAAWREPRRIAAAADIIVIRRKGAQKGLAKAIRAFESEFYGAPPTSKTAAQKYIFLAKHTGADISSTELRLLNSFSQDVSRWVCAPVAAYMREHKLCLDYKPFADTIKGMVSRARYIHTLYTAITAYRLARRYGADAEKAVLAAVLHDCAKDVSVGEAAEKYGLPVTDGIGAMHPKIRHAPLGALLAVSLFGITDAEVLSAIRWHTTGRENMTLLEKIIFVADYIEPTRGYEDTHAVYTAAFRDLDEAARLKYAEIHRKE